MAPKRLLDRRSFFRTAAGAVAAPYVLTSTAVGAPDKKPASDRVVAGAIGIGGRGGSLLGIHKDPRCTIGAVCDVDEQRLAGAQKRIGNCYAYADWRHVVDRQDLDAVTIATPDHWHALITIRACESGKDVYCEKPLSRSVVEGRRMVQVARRYGRVVQMGTQHRSRSVIRKACEWVRNGRLGKLEKVRLWVWKNRHHAVAAAQPVPRHFDYTMWLGPAPWAPYHPARCHFNFRWFMDYAGGYMTDWGTHMFSVISWALGTDHTGPSAVWGTGTEDPTNMYDVPVTMDLTYKFDDPDCVMTWQQPGDGAKGGPPHGMQVVGSEATLTISFSGKHTVESGDPDLSPTRPDELHLEVSNNHTGNWLDCIASRERPIVDVEIGHRMTCWCHLGNIAYLLGRKLRWDPVAERFIGDDEANRLLHVAYRQPWHL